MSSSLKNNILANYLGRFYVVGLGIFSVPLYLDYMGKEAYGLIGFFALLSGWLQLLDIGLSSTLARETVAYRAGNIDINTFRHLFFYLEGIFFIVGLSAGLSIYMGSDLISQYWIRADSLSGPEISSSIALMGIIFSINWISNIRRSFIVGFEQQVFLNICSSLFATIRLAITIAAFRHWGATPTVFFTSQMIVSTLDALAMWLAVQHWLPPSDGSSSFSASSLRKLLGFSVSIAVTTGLWVFVTQTDKLILSNFLSLSDFACFSVAMTLAGAVSFFSGPFSQALMPRMTSLFVSGNEKAFMSLYSEATQILAAIIFPVSMTLAVTAHPLLKAWTNDVSIADKAYLVLALYVLGNSILGVGGITYCLQFARGDLSLHLKNSVLFAVIQVPMMAFGVMRYGMIGAGAVWLLVNILALIILPGIIHRKFAPGFHLKWLFRDVLLIGLFGCIAPLMTLAIAWDDLSRWQVFFVIGIFMIVGVCISSCTTDRGLQFFKKNASRVRSL